MLLSKSRSGESALNWLVLPGPKVLVALQHIFQWLPGTLIFITYVFKTCLSLGTAGRNTFQRSSGLRTQCRQTRDPGHMRSTTYDSVLLGDAFLHYAEAEVIWIQGGEHLKHSVHINGVL